MSDIQDLCSEEDDNSSKSDIHAQDVCSEEDDSSSESDIQAQDLCSEEDDSSFESEIHAQDSCSEEDDSSSESDVQCHAQDSTKQSVKSDVQSIFHQYDDIQRFFFQGNISSFDINSCDSHGKTLLHHACEYGLTEGVSILLANKAQADVCDKKGYTPLHYACQNNQINYDICKIVIQGGPSLSLQCYSSGVSTIVSAQDKHYNRTILHYACIHGDVDVSVSLLKAGADPCVRDIDGNNPMHYACMYGHLECIRHFIANSQNPKESIQVSNKAGCTPFSVKTSSGGTILHDACDKGDFKPVEMLLEAGADPNVTDEFGFTPLMRAVVSTRKASYMVYSIITALCRSHCSVNAAFVPSKPSDSNICYSEGSTALHMAIDERTVNHSRVQALVDNGAALDARDVHGRTPLHIASMRGHFKMIKLLALSPESFHFVDNDSCTPLHYACKNSHLECVRRFMIQIPDVICDLMKVADKYGATPLSVRGDNDQTILHVACKKGDLSIVKKVLEAGADPNITDEFGFTPLMRAVLSTGTSYKDKSSIVTDLYKHNSNINAVYVPSQVPGSSPHVEGSTAMHMTIGENHPLHVQALVDYGAALDARDVHGRTPLHIASIQGHHHLIKLLAPSQESFHFEDNDGCTPLYYACKNSHLECFREFLVEIPDICHLLKVANKFGTTPLSVRGDNNQAILHIACDKGDLSVVKKVLEAGADPNVTDELGCTPIYYACKNSHLECVREFMVQIPDVISDLLKVENKFGATPLSVRGDNDQTILHIACDKGDLSVVEKVLEAGADPNVTDKLGCTPIYYACKNSHLECVREFMVQIPDVISDLMKTPNRYGDTPLSVQTDNDQTILHVACKKGDLSVVKKVLEAGADPNSLDRSTFTPLMLAVQHVDDMKAVDIITILCEFKCSLNIQASHLSRSVTALHLACELGKGKCVEILVAKGANLLVRTTYGSTPLHLACKEGYHTFTSLLITEETLKACDYIIGWTPLHYACQGHHIECVKVIVVGFSKLLLKIHKTYSGDILPFYSLRNKDGTTILHHAFMRNNIHFVENLLNLGADPNVQDNKGATPLMSALQCHGSDTDMDMFSLLSSLNWKPDIKDNYGCTALHYSAMYDIRIPLMLISAGCDITAVDNCGQTFSDLISKESLGLINKQLLRIDRRQIICVVGYPKCGKTTIIAAFQQAQQKHGTFQRLSARFQSTKVTVANCRTSGIDTKVITTQRLGSLIFFDFAGQSEYYVSHLAFLESALSTKGTAITFIMMVDLRCYEGDRIAQCKEWLFPIKSILKDHNMLNVILIGSHLDQVRSVSTSISSLQDTLKELKRTLGTPQMQFINCWGMDCRQLSSKGMTNLHDYLQSTHPAHNASVDSSQVPLGASLLFDRLKKSENPPLAITPSKIIDKLKDGCPPFPLTVKYIDSCCQDLAASGLVLYIPNREDAGESWLILEMEEILSRIHGKLFAPDSAEFPMHHKNLANQFGLVHVEELSLAFKDSPLDPEMVRKLLTAMEFCHPIDSSLMTEGILDGFFSKVSSDLHESLLFFPSLVKANEEPVVLSTESDIPGDDCHWLCWELSTVKPHFLHPRFQQAVFIRLACNRVQKHKSDLFTVEEHSCAISKNTMSWSTIHGVDVCVQIMHKSTIKVLARSRPGVKVSSLMEMFSSVVSDVLTVRANHAPGVDAYSVFRVMEKGTPGEHTVPVSTIIDVVQAGGMYVNSREHPPKLVSLEDLYLNWEISVTLLEKMVSVSYINRDVQATAEDVSADTHSGPVMIAEHYYESELPFSFTCLGFISLFILILID